jgi:phosphoglycerate dehydrogenase-like enzyme
LKNSTCKIAVTSRSFSQDHYLRQELLKRYSNVVFNDSGKTLDEEGLINFLKGADKAIVALEKINLNILSAVPTLKLISKYGVGLDNIPFKDLEEKNILLAWKGGVNKTSVAELTIHFILGLVHGSFHSHHDIQKSNWYQFKGFNLFGKTVGLIGLGNVGQEVVKMLQPFNVNILAYDILNRSDFCEQFNVKQVQNLESLLNKSEIVSIHVPYTSKTKLLLDASRFNQMKEGAFLINTARGGIVDERELLKALKTQKITSAAFDVFEKEPFENEELKSMLNFYFTSHIGGSSIESIHAMGLSAIDGLENGKIARAENFFDYEL